MNIDLTLYFVHDGLEDSILGRPLRCYKSITVDDEEEWHRCKIIIAHQAHKNTKCPNYTNAIEVTFQYILDISTDRSLTRPI